jgi:Uma2 family endonuclease
LKLGVYARAGVPECWLVNLLEGCIEVYREPAGDAYKSVRRYTPDEVIAPLFAPEWAVPVSELMSIQKPKRQESPRRKRIVSPGGRRWSLG